MQKYTLVEFVRVNLALAPLLGVKHLERRQEITGSPWPRSEYWQFGGVLGRGAETFGKG